MNTVVRAGDTVRRKAGPWTPTVHRVLAHVRRRGVSWVPEPLGLDEQGREVLSFIPGDVPHDMPEWVWSELVLTDVARALRQWHDATADYLADDGSVWGLGPRAPREVVCHNDFAPYNCVFRGGRFAAAIDFDLCAPGPRLWDIAYTAYRFVPLMPPAELQSSRLPGERSPFPIRTMASRLDAFVAAYTTGASLSYERSEVLAAVVERLEAIAATTDEHVRQNGVSALANHPAMYRAHARWLEGVR